MAYVTPTDLLFFGDIEMAQRAFVRPAQYDAALLRATIEETDRSAWTPTEQAEGDAAMARMQAACDRASAEADGYLGMLYATPLAAPVNPPVIIHSLNMARFWLYDDKSSDEVKYRYEQAIAWLTKVAEGMVKLDRPDTEEGGAGVGMPKYWSPGREFTHETLTDYDIP